MTQPLDARVVLRSADVCVIIDLAGGRLPALAHWGGDPGPLTAGDVDTLLLGGELPVMTNAVDEPVRVSLLPEHWTGWAGRPGLSGSRSGRDWSPKFTATALRIDGAAANGFHSVGAASVEVDAVDPVAGLSLTTRIELTPSGLLRAQAEVTNLADDPYTVDDLVLAFPVPAAAREVLDLAGRWGRERVPQRSPFTVGTHLREGRRGRTGADAAFVLHAGAPGFTFDQGEVWGVHVGWSGNHTHYAERLSSGEKVLGGGELLLPGEVVLARGQTYATPWVYGSHGVGLDAVAHRFHRFLRSRPGHPGVDRPVTINVWEAVYFDHDLSRLLELADRAASVGVERYVLDDGWFGSRRDDHSGLGDWTVSREVWPHGLHPLVDHVTSLGMEFGLWFEPEMISPDSDVARAHPDWIMATGGRRPVEARHQQVINLGIPACYAYVRDAIFALLAEYDIRYIKWDHNRDLVDAGTQPGGRPGVHEQTLAYYRLVDEIKAAHPGLEIETCSSGGARIDLGALTRCDRVWVSDCIDPLERQLMNRWTAQLVPPEMLGSHIASDRSHTTGRAHTLGFRAATAVFGHLGIEWDLTRVGRRDLDELAAWVALFKRHRGLLMGGETIRFDVGDDTVNAQGVVSADRGRAIYSFASLGQSVVGLVGRMRLPGLDAERRYRVTPLMLEYPPHALPPRWWGVARDLTQPPEELLQGRPPRLVATSDRTGVVATGAMLATVGLAHAPSLPEVAVLYLAEAVD